MTTKKNENTVKNTTSLALPGDKKEIEGFKPHIKQVEFARLWFDPDERENPDGTGEPTLRNMSACSRRLDVSRQTLYNWLDNPDYKQWFSDYADEAFASLKARWVATGIKNIDDYKFWKAIGEDNRWKSPDTKIHLVKQQDFDRLFDILEKVIAKFLPDSTDRLRLQQEFVREVGLQMAEPNNGSGEADIIDAEMCEIP